jgi:hypothetical protein
MVDVSVISMLSELGLKPTEVLVLALLWQNIRNTKVLLYRLVDKVNRMDSKIAQIN